MDEPEQMVAIRWAFAQDHFVLRAHGHIEMLLEGLTAQEVRAAGAGAELLEDYPERREGHTKLLIGYARGDKPVHLAVNVQAFESDWSEPMAVVTVYEPHPLEWTDERTSVTLRDSGRATSKSAGQA